MCALNPYSKIIGNIIHAYVHTVEPGYNDIGLCNTSFVTFVVQINFSLLAITLHASSGTTVVYSDTKYSLS